MRHCSSYTYVKLFAFTVIYVLLSGLLVQRVILLYFFPDLHAGEGFLKGMDSAGFHHQALQLLAQMKLNGWSVWSLRPEGMNSPPGIMAAVYYLFGPQPYFLLILNGVLWGIVSVTWLASFQRMFPKNGRWNLVPVLIIIILPSSLQWTSQFLKDIFSIAGFSLLFYAFVQSVQFQESTDWIKWLRGILMSLLLGAVLIGIVRPYMLQFVVAGSVATLPIIGGAYLARVAPRGLMTIVAIVAFITLLLSLIGNTTVKDRRHDRLDLLTSNQAVLNQSIVTQSILHRAVLRVQLIRNGYCASKRKMGSAIDCDVNMTSWGDAFSYLPRAMEIALLSPFPNMWFASANAPGGSQMRLIAGVETLFAYLIFLVAVILLISRRIKLTLSSMLAMIYLLIPLLIETYGNPEIGTLYRMRYIFWTGLMGMALNYIIGYCLSRKQVL